MSGRHLRRKVLELLKSPDVESAIDQLRGEATQRVLNPLFSALYNQDEGVKWHAVTAMGLLVADLAENDMESARNVMRRLMWSLNEESGGIGWGAPEAMGEIMARHDGLAQEFAPILVSYLREDGNFLEYEVLQRGVAWALGRLAQVRPRLLQSLDAAPHLLPHLDSQDATVRGLAAWAMGWLAAGGSTSQLHGLLEDASEIMLYDGGHLIHRKVCEMARQALERIAQTPKRRQTDEG